MVYLQGAGAYCGGLPHSLCSLSDARQMMMMVMVMVAVVVG